MKPVEQRQLHKADQVGDCWKVCIASILELDYDDVPHFYEQEENGEVDSGWNATQTFLRGRDFVLASFELMGMRPFLKFRDIESRYLFTCPGHWIASVRSPRKHAVTGEEIAHAVVMHGGDIAFDPHPRRDQGHIGFENAYPLVAV